MASWISRALDRKKEPAPEVYKVGHGVLLLFLVTDVWCVLSGQPESAEHPESSVCLSVDPTTKTKKSSGFGADVALPAGVSVSALQQPRSRLAKEPAGALRCRACRARRGSHPIAQPRRRRRALSPKTRQQPIATATPAAAEAARVTGTAAAAAGATAAAATARVTGTAAATAAAAAGTARSVGAGSCRAPGQAADRRGEVWCA
jgi:hypothetical protein